jgi:hypothetical protein
MMRSLFLLALLSKLTRAAAEAGSTCATEFDCSLNGACVAGVCRCVSFWSGADCSRVSLGAVPAATLGALQPAADASHWCASALADGNGTWHVYSALMDLRCGLNSWQRNSVITHATGPSPVGPFSSETIVQSYFSHNPKALRANDGTWLIFHIGCGSGTSPITTCTNGTTPVAAAGGGAAAGAAAVCDDYGTNVLSGPSPTGPWTAATVISPAPSPTGFPRSADNPSALILPNGTTWVMFRSYNKTGKYHSVIGMARAPHWSGPYTLDPAPLFPQWMEDPFLFHQPETDSFHALFHTMGGCPEVGCHAFSKDGFSWRVSPGGAYNFSVQLDNGATVQLKRRERPQLVVDPRSGRPTHLLNGAEAAQHDGGQEDKTFSIAVPLVFPAAAAAADARAGGAPAAKRQPWWAAQRVVSMWYAPDNNWRDAVALIAAHAAQVTTVFSYCGLDISDAGKIIPTFSPICAQLFPALAALGVRAEISSGSGNCSIAAMRKLWADPASPPAVLAAALAANASGVSIDFEPQADNCKGSPTGTAADAAPFAAWLASVRAQLAPHGIRLTVDVASWSPVLAEYATLAPSVDVRFGRGP